VPAGFRRNGRAVITTPDTALRLPEDPACRVLVSCTDDSRRAVTAALRAVGLATRPE
jgi:hypothetical protein